MVFKNFRVQVVIRVILLAGMLSALAWCLVYGYYLRSVYAGAAAVIMVVEFIWYVDRFNLDVKSFLVSLMQRDFTTHYQSRGRSKSFDELYESLNSISEIFKKISAEKETQFRFLEMLVDHLRVGILSFDEAGKIKLANHALKGLLKTEVLFSLHALQAAYPIFVSAVREIRSGETQLVRLRVNDELLQLSIHASEFRLEDVYHKLVSIQNIRSELDAREMEAWQKLIRVLTHEIMNSVSPVISLSETLHGLVLQHHDLLEQMDPRFYETMDKGLDAIKVRTAGLYQFTQSYRKLTGVPKLFLKETNVRDIVARVSVLLEDKMVQRGITFDIHSTDVPLVADPDLMEHVLINLLLNAMDAVAEKQDARIEVRGFQNDQGNVFISVKDNGEGIDETTAEKIFIPFFTTRENGSGVGLALTRQILHLHRADIRFTSEKGKGTEFLIVF